MYPHLDCAGRAGVVLAILVESNIAVERGDRHLLDGAGEPPHAVVQVVGAVEGGRGVEESIGVALEQQIVRSGCLEGVRGWVLQCKELRGRSGGSALAAPCSQQGSHSPTVQHTM